MLNQKLELTFFFNREEYIKQGLQKYREERAKAQVWQQKKEKGTNDKSSNDETEVNPLAEAEKQEKKECGIRPLSCK